MKLIYNYETGHRYQDWVNEGLPIGNGFLGAKIYGSASHEHIQINEKSLWTGGPLATDTKNDGGNIAFSHIALDKIQLLLAQGNNDKAAALAEKHLVGPYDRAYGRFIPLLDYDFIFDNQENVSDYQRSLDLDKALVDISYRVDGLLYKRRYFASYPDRVIVMHFAAEDDAVMNFRCIPKNNQTVIKDTMSDQTETDTDAKIKSMSFAFDGSDYFAFSGTVFDNDRFFAGGLKINDLEGEVTFEDNQLIFKNVRKVTLLFHAATDFEQVYPLYRQTQSDVLSTLEHHRKRLNQSYAKLLQAHLQDYQAIFKRVDFRLEQAIPVDDTSQLLKQYQKGALNPYLEILLFQYGRYLMIASSRSGKNALPANLQGIWNAAVNPAWNSDYHLNINLQMNYWPTFNTNMAEIFEPLLLYVEDLAIAGQIAAKHYANIEKHDAWLTHTQNTPYGWTCPGWDYYWGWSPASNAWIMKNIYDHFRFTQDIEMLNERIFPLLESTVAFWTDFLVYDDLSDRYVSSPSYSPEQGPISIGNTYDQSLVYELYKMYLEACELVLKRNDTIYQAVLAQIEKLKPLHIGADGQIKEWYEENHLNTYANGTKIEKTDLKHRHVSELVGLYPGSLFSDQSYRDAAKVTLNYRGDGGTGWSKANKINLWARLRDGDRAYKLLNEQIQNNILNNLWNTHPPFQLDGNSGLTSGIAEMLLQSYEQRILLLPALPKAWKAGHIKGLVAENAVVCDLYWSKNELVKAHLSSREKHQQILLKENIHPCTIEPQAYVLEENDYYILDFNETNTFSITK